MTDSEETEQLYCAQFWLALHQGTEMSRRIAMRVSYAVLRFHRSQGIAYQAMAWAIHASAELRRDSGHLFLGCQILLSRHKWCTGRSFPPPHATSLSEEEAGASAAT